MRAEFRGEGELVGNNSVHIFFVTSYAHVSFKYVPPA